MGVSPLQFTGNSQYSSDFQTILTRAVQIASIPLQQLQNQDSTNLSKITQLGTLNQTASGLTSALKSLGSVAAGKAISASSSNTGVVKVTSSGATGVASYTINSVTSLATAASETSVSGYADSASTLVSSTGMLDLVVGTNHYSIHLTSDQNNLVGLQNAINQLGAGVSASILTTGNGNYLSISTASLGATTLQLNDDPDGANTNLLTNQNQGSDAVFKLNNLTVTRKSNTINDLIPGATLTLQSTSATATTISLASDRSQLASAIQSFATAYNSVVDQINAQSGQNAGVLLGDSVIWQLQGDLRQLTSYTGSGGVRSLADMGITLGSNGKMTFDQNVLNSLTDGQLNDAFNFFGTDKSGFGGLSAVLNQISDPVSGIIANEISTLTASDQRLQTQINAMVTSINKMQYTLFDQLTQADTLISSLNSQQDLLTSTIQSLNYVLYGKQAGS
jgi:flagellar hook-associated protein 2